MNCQEFDKLIIDYIEGDLASNQNKVVEDHLKHCHKCKIAFEKYNEIILNTNQLPNFRCPDTVIEKVYSSIPVKKRRIPRPMKIYWNISKSLSWKIRYAVAAAAVILTVLMFYPGGEKPGYDQQIYTAEEIEKARRDVETAFGYLRYSVLKAENAVETYVVKESLNKSFKITINNILKPLLNGG